VISLVELRRVYSEWKTRLERVHAILQPTVWRETEWKKFGHGIIELLQRRGTSWKDESKRYWDLRWNLKEGGELICQAEFLQEKKISVVIAQSGGFAKEVESYTWFWAEYDLNGEFLFDPYWVDGTWNEAVSALLIPYQYQAGYYLAGTAPTPPSLLLGHTTETPSTYDSEPSPKPEEALA
jgi:hypothetical protein